MKSNKLKLIFATTAALILEVMAPTFIQVANAANAPQFTETIVRFDRHKELTPTGVTVCAKPSGASTVAVETSVVITFPTIDPLGGNTDFLVNATAANWTVTTTNLPTDPNTQTGATVWPGIGTATNVAGHSVTFPSGDLTAATLYCFNIIGTSTLTTSSAAAPSTIVGGTLYTKDITPATVNQTNWSTSVVTNDQIAISAIVPPNFSITLSGNADPFLSNLDPDLIISTGGIAVTIKTNAVGGWVAWVKDSQQGLYSATSAYTIPSKGSINQAPETLVANSEGYGMVVALTTPNVGGCTNHLDAEYNGTASDVGFLSSAFQPIAACTRDGALAGTSDGDVLTLTERATIRPGTPAGSDYSDIVTVVGAGNF